MPLRHTDVSSSSNIASSSSTGPVRTMPIYANNVNGELYAPQDELRDEGPLFSRREESVGTFPRPPTKLRIGGSRSSKLASNKRFKEERTRTIDSTDRQSTHLPLDNSKSRDNGYVRILGRGGAGARPRNEFKEPKSVESKAAGKKPQEEQVQLEVSVVRPTGRGGLGWRLRTMPKDRSQSTSDLLSGWDIGKASKTRPNRTELTVPSERHINSRLSSPASERSSETLSTLHFTGERSGPSPDFFGRTAGRTSMAGEQSNVIEEGLENEQLLPHARQRVCSAKKLLRTLGDVPTAILRDNRYLEPKAKTNRSERFSLLLTTFKSTTIQKPHLRESISTSSLQSDGDNTSLASFDAQTYFTGSLSLSSGPSTASFGTDNEATSQNPADTMAFSIRSSTSSRQSSPVQPTDLEQPVRKDEITPPTISITPPTQSYKGRSTASEAAALSRPKTTDQPFASATEEVSVVHDADEGTFTPQRRRPESWTGEWNAGMFDVIQALRELR